MKKKKEIYFQIYVKKMIVIKKKKLMSENMYINYFGWKYQLNVNLITFTAMICLIWNTVHWQERNLFNPKFFPDMKISKLCVIGNPLK